MAQKGPLPFVLPAAWHEGARQKALRRLRIKPSNIAKIYKADGWVLYVPTKKSHVKPPKSMIPSRESERRIRLISNYIEEQKGYIEIERAAEMAAQKEEIRSLSGRERELYGRAILGLKGRSAGRRFELWLYRFSRDRAIDTEIGSGDLVLISRGDPLKSDLSGTVMAVGRHYIEVALDQKAPSWIRQGEIRIDLYVNDVTFRRMEENLERLRHAPAPYDAVRDIALGLKRCEGARPVSPPSGGELNDGQRAAAAMALGSATVSLIHGPPGTGKTTTVVEIIRRFVREGKRVLAAADSNVAVDNMLARLADSDELNVVRVGHPARIDEKLIRHALFSKVEKDPRTLQVKQMLEEIGRLVERRNRHSKPTPSRLRGMSRERVLKLAAEGRAYRGVDAATIRSMASWIEEDKKVERFFGAVRDLERAIVREILESADVVLATNGMVGAEALEGVVFDVAVVDEASQQMEASTLLPLMRAPKAVLAGDHRQLPPTVVSELPALRRSLFEKLMETEAVPSALLRTQYRMNETIMDFPNRLMYEGKLQAHPDVARRRLRLTAKPEGPYAFLLEPEPPVAFADTADLEAFEARPHRGNSYENPFEAETVRAWVEQLLRCGVAADEIGVISPYLAQVKRLRILLEREGLPVEVKSVDGFQGREKEVIIISFVRANAEGKIGFLKDRRRLNVAMTRARSKLLMVGHLPTLARHAPFDALRSWLERRGALFRLKPDQ